MFASTFVATRRLYALAIAVLLGGALATVYAISRAVYDDEEDDWAA
jgi:hypothetical protein